MVKIYIRITHTPYGYLFQKSEHLGATWVHLAMVLKQAKIDKFELGL